MGQSATSRRFQISWHDDYGYRVSVPNLLEESERLTVVPASEYDRLREALELIAHTDPVDAVLDPDRALRVARQALDD